MDMEKTGSRIRAGAVDLGTQTFRMVVADLTPGSIEVLEHYMMHVRLGEGLRATGRIRADAMERGLAALRAFKAAAERHDLDIIRACGTHALRQAENAGEFLDAAALLGFDVQVLDGGQEAALSLAGVEAGLPGLSYPVMVMDIGGGSSEFILAEKGRILYSHSFKLGAVTLTEQCRKSVPPAPGARECMERRAASGLAPLGSRRPACFNTLVGVGGTATTLAAICLEMTSYDPFRVRGLGLGLDRLRGVLARIAGLSREELAALKGLEPQRADIILAGTVLVVKAMEVLGASELVISDGGLLLGLLATMKRSCFPC